MTDKTVSVCCGAKIRYNMSGQKFCSECLQVVDTPTHSPTDVCICSCGGCMDKKICSLGFCKVHPPTETTVDKWEWRDGFFKILSKGTILFGVPGVPMWKELEDYVNNLILSSVQEAKAEMIEKIEGAKKKDFKETVWRCPKCTMPGEENTYCPIDRKKLIKYEYSYPSRENGIYNQGLDDLLASLKQEEKKA